MDRTLQNFITALRRSGVKVSVAETMDALRAAELAGYVDRLLLKDFLSVSLAKSLPEKEIFEGCFHRFFSMDDISGEDFPVEKTIAPSVSQPWSPLTQMLLAGDGGGLSLALREAAGRAETGDIQYPTQRGIYLQRVLRELGLEALDRDIQRLSDEGERESIDLARELESMRDTLVERARRLIERQIELYAAGRLDDIFEGYMRNVSLTALEERDLARIHAVIQRMVKHLQDRYSRRPKTARKGHLDFKKTLRQSVTYGGLPFDTRWKLKKIDRPEVVAICDVSRSVANVVRFFLLILYSLNEVISKIRSFAFCSNLVEVSSLFEQYPLPEALARIQSGAGLPILMNRTDYGSSFLDFRDQYADCLTKRATVIILGDARNNYWNPRTDVLRFISERCNRLIWLNPEVSTLWGAGDSEMENYLPYCTIARECSTLRHLERVMESLLHTH